jgi:hypothetical protein
MSKTSRIKEISDPAGKEWWDGRSNKEAISRWSERAHRESDGARHRASSGEVKLPSTGEERSHSTSQPAGHRGDFYERARRDLNHDLRNDAYMPGVRRLGK